jgi:translation initiation factor 5B
VGSLEALIYELKEAEVPIKRAEIGDVSRKDVIEASTVNNPMFQMLKKSLKNLRPRS